MEEVLILVVLFSKFGMVRLKRQLVRALRIQVKNLRLRMVDPDNGVKMRHGAPLMVERSLLLIGQVNIDGDQ